jgi:uncharacterized membrane protein YecN with MAPEG domain
MSSVVALFLLQEEPEIPAGAAGMGIGFMVLWFALIILMIAAMWKVFEKAGKPGWAAIIPIYNIVVLLEIAGKPVWWIILMLIPFVNIVVGIIVVMAVAKSFGKGAGFGLGLLFLAPIFYPMLAWGDAQYRGPQAA